MRIGAGWFGALLATVGLLLGAGCPALQAKGGGLRLDRHYYAPGDMVRARAKPWFGDGKFVDSGPYHAFLVSGAAYIPPERVPEDAVPVGTVGVNDSGPSHGSVVAHIEFVMPEVEPGKYSLWLYDSRGRATAVGDISGAGLVRVVRGSDQAARREIAYWQGRLRQLRSTMISRTLVLRETSKDLKEVKRELRDVMAENAAIEQRISDSRVSPARGQADEPTPGLPLALASGVTAAALISLLLSTLAQRRTQFVRDLRRGCP